MTLATIFPTRTGSNLTKLIEKARRKVSDEITEDTSNSHRSYASTSTMATPPLTSERKHIIEGIYEATIEEQTRGDSSKAPDGESAVEESFMERKQQVPETAGRPYRKIPPPPPPSEMIAYEAQTHDGPGPSHFLFPPPDKQQKTIPIPAPERTSDRSIPGMQSTTDGSCESSNVDLLELSGVMMQEEQHLYEGEEEDQVRDLLSFTPPNSLHTRPDFSYKGTSDALTIEKRATQDDMSLPSSSIASSVLSRSAETPTSSYLASSGKAGGPKTVLYCAVGSLDDTSGSYKKLKSTGRDFKGPGIAAASATQIAPAPRRKDVAPTEATTVRTETKPTKQPLPSGTKRETVPHPTRDLQSPIQKASTLEKKAPTKEAAAGKPKTVLLSETEKDRKKGKKKVRIQKTVEEFVPSSAAYTPLIKKKKFEYLPAEQRTPVQKMSSPMGTLARPNFRDALRRVAMIIRQHIVKIEHRFDNPDRRNVLFDPEMKKAFLEDNFLIPRYKCTMVRVPMARPSMVYAMRKIDVKYAIPSEEEIYDFAHQLFKSVQLSSECSIVCLIYVERLMETAKVPLLACTWRPIFMCGLLLASKVWQDLASWNIEFASVYPQYSLDAINRLELQFLRMVKWDLYISSR
jgi:hypothetical protein